MYTYVYIYKYIDIYPNCLGTGRVKVNMLIISQLKTLHIFVGA